ncbi:MAG: transcriptional repressor [Oscillibacter sp.]|nr:transcriptional repressor [Oscillibacter sp.]
MGYRTRQQQAVLDCFARRPDAARTAAEVAQELHESGQNVGLATIYRQLEKLEHAGEVHKVVTPEGAFYRYCPHAKGHADCLLVRCEKCGRIEHVDCEELAKFAGHMAEHHRFRLDLRRTVLAGTCERCLGEEAK